MPESGALFWRLYRDRRGRSPVADYLSGLSDADAAKVAATMNLAAQGRVPVRKLTRGGGVVHEVCCVAAGKQVRILLSREGRHGQVLLAVGAFTKKGVAMQDTEIDRALGLVADWRARGAALKAGQALPPGSIPRPRSAETVPGLLTSGNRTLRAMRGGLE